MTTLLVHGASSIGNDVGWWLGSHGWGRTPVVATVDGVTRETSVWRGKDGRTLLAVPAKVRGAKGDGDTVRVELMFSL